MKSITTTNKISKFLIALCATLSLGVISAFEPIADDAPDDDDDHVTLTDILTLDCYSVAESGAATLPFYCYSLGWTTSSLLEGQPIKESTILVAVRYHKDSTICKVNPDVCTPPESFQ